jgi:hypothetical protein
VPSHETAWRRQKALLWNKIGVRDDGEPAVEETPTPLWVRWVWTKADMLDTAGNPISVDAQAVVDRDIAPDSEMWLGSLEDWLGTGSGQPEDDVCVVKSIQTAYNIKGTAVRRELGLVRYRGVKG